MLSTTADPRIVAPQLCGGLPTEIAETSGSVHRLPAASGELPLAAVLHSERAKATADAACRKPGSNTPNWLIDTLMHAASGGLPLAADLEVAVAKAIAQDPESLLSALPPSAAELEAWAQQGADVAAAEDAALAWQRLLPALQAASGSPLSAMAQALFEACLRSWIAERTACTAPGLSPCLQDASAALLDLHQAVTEPQHTGVLRSLHTADQGIHIS